MWIIGEKSIFSHSYLEEWKAVIRSYLPPPVAPIYIFSYSLSYVMSFCEAHLQLQIGRHFDVSYLFFS